MSEYRVLFVDDEPNVLDGIRRSLRKEFVLETANGGHEALEKLTTNGPYAVVVSDQRMPQMDGVTLLSEVQKHWPNTVRVMLTGNADLDTAVQAINLGSIYRFLLKPAQTETLVLTVRDAIRQYQLVQAEKELLEGTLRGSVNVLAEVLSLVNPTSFGQSLRIRDVVAHMAEKLELPDKWLYELAALLSQLGCINLDEGMIKRFYAGDKLDKQEMDRWRAHPTAGAEMLKKIPRLEDVAEMVRMQMDPFREDVHDPEVRKRYRIQIGGHLLAISLTYDRMLLRGMESEQAIQALRIQPSLFNPAFVNLLADYTAADLEPTILRQVKVSQLVVGMVLNEDVLAQNGMLLAARNTLVTQTLLQRLDAFATTIGVQEPISVLTTA